MGYEQFILALCLWREARGEGPEGMRAVYHVVDNRSKDTRWPNTLIEVALQPKQFSCFNAGERQDFPIPGKKDWKSWIQAVDIVLLPGADPTHGANHYYAPGAITEPWWANGETPCYEIGHHLFYKL